MKKFKYLIACFLFTLIVLTACGAAKPVSAVAVNAIEQDLGGKISPSSCKYCEEKKMIYVAFDADGLEDEQAVLVLDDEGNVNKILYQHIYDTITEDDHDKNKQYGDFALAMNDVNMGDDRWNDVELK